MAKLQNKLMLRKAHKIIDNKVSNFYEVNEAKSMDIENVNHSGSAKCSVMCLYVTNNKYLFSWGYLKMVNGVQNY